MLLFLLTFCDCSQPSILFCRKQGCSRAHILYWDREPLNSYGGICVRTSLLRFHFKSYDFLATELFVNQSHLFYLLNSVQDGCGKMLICGVQKEKTGLHCFLLGCSSNSHIFPISWHPMTLKIRNCLDSQQSVTKFSGLTSQAMMCW